MICLNMPCVSIKHIILGAILLSVAMLNDVAPFTNILAALNDKIHLKIDLVIKEGPQSLDHRACTHNSSLCYL